MLIIVSGPDRVGKSTLISKMADYLGVDDVSVKHHSAPPKDQKAIFDFYKEDILEFADGTKQYCIFDRAWPCSFILEQFRRNNLGHLEDLIDLELWINDHLNTPVVHVGQFRPWHWSAPLHVEELKDEAEHEDADWYIRDQYITRMQEHETYQTQLLDFYDRVTMFPNVQLMDSKTPEQVIQLCKQAILDSGR
jgi:hypothetical protein